MPKGGSRRKKDRQGWQIREQLAMMKGALLDEKNGVPIVPVLKIEVDEIRKVERMCLPDEKELSESLARLQAEKIMFAVREEPRVFRVLLNEAEIGKALRDGLTIWSPRDMFEYLHLPSDIRQKFRRFKKIFADSSFEWKGPDELKKE